MLQFRYIIVNTLYKGDKYNNNNNKDDDYNDKKEHSSIWVEHSQGPLDFRGLGP
jgi:hypothetical protein